MPPPPISEDLCWAIIRMTSFLSVEDTSTYTGVSRSKIYEVMAQHREMGRPTAAANQHMVGRPHHLSLEEVTVSFSFVTLMHNLMCI